MTARPRKAPIANPLETPILHDIRVALGSEPDLVLWRNNTGALPDKRGIPVKFGLCEGSADLIGVLRIDLENIVTDREFTGRFIALEVKRPIDRTGARRKEMQRLFRELVRRMGGFAAAVNSVEQAKAALDRAREGESE
jgi:hypothetical protein